MENSLYCELKNGLRLYTNAMTENSNGYAKGLKLRGFRVYLTENLDGSKLYLITKNNMPVYESHSYEEIGFYFDKVAILKTFRIKTRKKVEGIYEK